MVKVMSGDAIFAREQHYTAGTYPKRNVAIVRGEGARLYDADGRMYIDCVGGQGAANLGHAHPAVVAAIQEQSSRLLNCPEIFYNDQRADYLAELADVLPFPARFFLCNSGAEAVEAGIKFARLLSKRTKVVAAMRGFHGRTLGALSATWERKYREPFTPLVPDFVHVVFGDAEALAAAVDDETAAVLLEPVQGEGGVRPAPEGYLSEARRICDTHGALLAIDEVQTGFGRTGRMFAIEHEQVIPDLLLLAKSIAAGLPMGAVALHERFGSLPVGSHGTTFGGNPLLCAAARAALQAYRDEDLATQAADKGAWLLQRLRAMHAPVVREVRGIGLLIGIELRTRVQSYLQQLLDRGILALPAGPTVLRLLPPLVISYDDLETVVATVEAVLQSEKGQ
jgi:acetylornithine/LysW-gamma-L-lysine aminotransferase